MQSKRAVTIFVILVMAAAVVLGFAASRITTPDQQAARARPPTPAVLTERAARRQLTSTVTLRAHIAALAATNVFGPQPSTGRAVVTRLYVKVGSAVANGALLFAVSDQPLFVFFGDVPAYREMATGMSGTDVSELQAGLKAVGYNIDDPPGAFGLSTSATVAKWYARNGYSVDGDAGGAAGVSIPVGEFAFVPRLPATVSRLPFAVGSVLPSEPDPGAAITLASGTPVARGIIGVADKPGVHVGNRVSIALDSGPTLNGTVRTVDSALTTDTPDGSVGYGIAFTSPKFRTVDAGRDATVTISTQITSSPKLVVPLVAVQSDANGDAHVVVLDRNGMTATVNVTVLAAGDGYAAVEPTAAASLKVGDRVVVG